MAALITNVWTGWLADRLTRRHQARVVIEGCGHLAGYLRATGPRRLALTLPGAALNLPPCTVRVYDGVVEAVTLRASGQAVVAEIATTVVPEARLTFLPGTPARAVVDLAAAPLVRGLAGRVFVVDAGHGGMDRGGLGPIDLEEKNVVLDVALRLENLLEQHGSVPVMTRRRDVTTTPADRAAAVAAAQPEAVLSLHTHASADRRVKGAATYAHGRKALPLAEAIQDQLRRKLELADRGVHLAGGPPFSPGAHSDAATEATGDDGPPAVTIETVAISNPVEEGWLRSHVYRQRLAQAIMNGLAVYLGVAVPSHAREEETRYA